MPNVTPLSREDLTEMQALLDAVERGFGFVPNSLLTMARQPEIMKAFTTMSGTILGPGSVDRQTKQLVAFMASNAAGCRYCQAHTSSQAVRAGAPEEKIGAAFEFETSALFSEAERAAMRLARDAALVPNATTAAHFAALNGHFDDAQIVEIVAVISLFGFLNRWNDTMATTLEEEPLRFGARQLSAHGWSAGKHG